MCPLKFPWVEGWSVLVFAEGSAFLGDPVECAEGRIAEFGGEARGEAVECSTDEAEAAAGGDSLGGDLDALGRGFHRFMCVCVWLSHQ